MFDFDFDDVPCPCDPEDDPCGMCEMLTGRGYIPGTCELWYDDQGRLQCDRVYSWSSEEGWV